MGDLAIKKDGPPRFRAYALYLLPVFIKYRVTVTVDNIVNHGDVWFRIIRMRRVRFSIGFAHYEIRFGAQDLIHWNTHFLKHSQRDINEIGIGGVFPYESMRKLRHVVRLWYLGRIIRVSIIIPRKLPA